MSRTSPTGWVDPVPTEEWARHAAWQRFLRQWEAKRSREREAALAKEAARGAA